MAEDVACEPKEIPVEVKTTHNIYLLAAYMAHGASIEKIDRTDPHKVLISVSGKGLGEIERCWMSPGNLLKKYADSIRDLKTLVHTS